MYQYLSAIVLPLQGGAQWEALDVSSRIVAHLYRQYREVILTLKRDEETLYVSMDSLRNDYATFENTVLVLLQMLSGATLETLAELPPKTAKYVRYENATRTGYRARLARYKVAEVEHYPRAEKHDLILSRPNYNTDLSLIHKHCLVSVNGFYHSTEMEQGQLYVIGGGLSAMRYNAPHIGITSFLDIGEVRRHKLAEEAIQNDDEASLKDRVVITTPETLDNKSFFLVLGGYLLFPEEGKLWQINENTLHLDLNAYPYIERLLESRHYLDLHSLELSVADINEEVIWLEEAWSDAVIRRYLRLTQTFLVVLDTPKLFTQKIPLRTIGTPGLFTTVQEPRLPLIGQFGRSLEYWKTKENQYWAINVQDSFYRHYLFSRQRRDTLRAVTEQLSFDHPFHHSQASMLEIGAYL